MALAAIVLLPSIYVASYLMLTFQGRFEPAIWGIHLVKWYEWAPRGFSYDDHWNLNLMYFYGPLYWTDTHYWHKPSDAYNGKYPIRIPVFSGAVVKS